MNRIRQALSQISEILVLYLRLLILATTFYAIVYCCLKHFEVKSLTDVENNDSLDSRPAATRSDL